MFLQESRFKFVLILFTLFLVFSFVSADEHESLEEVDFANVLNLEGLNLTGQGLDYAEKESGDVSFSFVDSDSSLSSMEISLKILHLIQKILEVLKLEGMGK